jgi:hypothetical protein
MNSPVHSAVKCLLEDPKLFGVRISSVERHTLSSRILLFPDAHCSFVLFSSLMYNHCCAFSRSIRSEYKLGVHRNTSSSEIMFSSNRSNCTLRLSEDLAAVPRAFDVLCLTVDRNLP